MRTPEVIKGPHILPLPLFNPLTFDILLLTSHISQHQSEQHSITKHPISDIQYQQTLLYNNR